MSDAPERENRRVTNYLLATVLPLILGSVLTLSGAMFTAQMSKQDKLLADLRTAYVAFFTETDAIDADLKPYFRELHDVFTHYYEKGAFVGKRLTSQDRQTLESLRKQTAEMERRVRKAAYSILLLEPAPRVHLEVQAFLTNTIEYLSECDRLAALLPHRFEYSAALAKELEEKGTLIQNLERIDAQYENKADAFDDFVDTMLQDPRWRE